VLLAATTITTSMSLTTQPSSESCMFLTVDGMSGTGSITITGLVSGASTPETFAFTVDGFRQSTNIYSSITGITTTGFTAGTLKVQACTPQGQPVLTERLVKSNLKVRFIREQAALGVETPGLIETGKTKLVYLENDIIGNDIIVDGDDRWITQPPIARYGYDGIHHYDCVVDKEVA